MAACFPRPLLTAAVLYLSITRQPIDPLASHLITIVVGYFFGRQAVGAQL